jgi:Cu/Ag efflux protein CusF
MNKRAWAGMAVGLMMGTLGAVAAEMASDMAKEKPAMVDAAVVSITATVKAIDYKTRMVTLEKSDGTTVDMQVGEEAVRFNEVKKGDIVDIDFMVSVAMVVESGFLPKSQD